MKYKILLKKSKQLFDVTFIDFENNVFYYYDEKQIYQNYKFDNKDNLLYETDDFKLIRQFSIKDKNNKYICEGDVININQTVNGENLFIVKYNDIDGIVLLYSRSGNEYQYNKQELLDIEMGDDEKEIEVIGNIYLNYNMEERLAIKDRNYEMSLYKTEEEQLEAIKKI